MIENVVRVMMIGEEKIETRMIIIEGIETEIGIVIEEEMKTEKEIGMIIEEGMKINQKEINIEKKEGGQGDHQAETDREVEVGVNHLEDLIIEVAERGVQK